MHIEHAVCVCVYKCMIMCESVCGRALSTDFTLLRSTLIQPAIFFCSGHIPLFPVHLVSMELICPCLCPPVYSMGRSVGGLERLHHLFLPGRRRPVQGEAFKEFQSSVFSLSVNMHLWAKSGGLVRTVMNVLCSCSVLSVLFSLWGLGCRLVGERMDDDLNTAS